MYCILHITTGEYIYTFLGILCSGQPNHEFYLYKTNLRNSCIVTVCDIVRRGIAMKNSGKWFIFQQCVENEFEIIEIEDKYDS
jgi:hypothetical protein